MAIGEIAVRVLVFGMLAAATGMLILSAYFLYAFLRTVGREFIRGQD